MSSNETNDCHLQVDFKESKGGCDIEAKLPGAESITYKTDEAHHSVTVMAEHHVNKTVMHGGSQTISIPDTCTLENSESVLADGVCRIHFNLKNKNNL